VDWVNGELEQARRIHAGSDYIGSFHKHPGRQAVPSGWDLKQAKQIVDDPDYKQTVFVVIIACDGPKGTRAYLLHKGDTNFKEARLVVAAQGAAQASPQSDAIAAEIAQLEASGWITERRRAQDGRLVLNVRQPGSNVVVSFLVSADHPRCKPAILAQMQTPWPQGSPDICSAATRLMATDSMARSRRLADLVDVLHRHGLRAQALHQSDAGVTFALRYPGLGTAGFMVVPTGVGVPSIYGADLQLRDLQITTGLDAWAGDVRRMLIGEHAQRAYRRLRMGIGIAAITIGLAGLLHELGLSRDIVASLLGRLGR
jgi:hypothetical protein